MAKSLDMRFDAEVLDRLVRGRRLPLPERGGRHGKLTVTGRLAYVVSGIPRLKISCRCDCGAETWPYAQTIQAGRAKSCGCEPKVSAWPEGTRASDHPLYTVWRGMKQRCFSPTSHAYRDYGGRGITMCDEWRFDFEAFRDWGIAAGYRKGLTIDREDVNGNYEPSNCRWANAMQQARNRRVNVRVSAFGETKTVAEWVSDPRCITNEKALYYRLANGWSPEAALTAGKDIRLVEAFGESKTLREWSRDERCAVSYIGLWQRMNLYGGYTIEDAITLPPHSRRP